MATREERLAVIETEISKLLRHNRKDRQFLIDAVIRIMGTTLNYDNIPEVPGVHEWYSDLVDYNESRKFPDPLLTNLRQCLN